jgi:hypothetical protein
MVYHFALRRLFLVLSLLFLSGCGVFSPTSAPTLVPTTNIQIPATGGTPTPMLLLPIPAQSTDVPLSHDVAQTPTATDTPFPSPTPLPSPTALPTAAPTLPPSPLPTGILSGWMPWGLVPSIEGLWAVRSDGGKVVLLTNDPIFDLAVAPSGRVAAYLTHPDPNNVPEVNPFGYTIKIIFLSTGEVRTIATLDPKGPNADPNSALRVVNAYDHGAMVWSPGGTYLAFVSGQEGNSGEIYFYSMRSEKQYRLPAPPTGDSPTYAYNLHFSPSGTRIYSDRAYDFNPSAGAVLAGAWVSGTDGTLVQVAANDFTGENLVAWLNDGQVLLSSGSPDCGEQNLRVVNLSTKQAQVYWPGCYADLSYQRALSSVILSVTPDIVAFQTDTPTGLYRVRLWDRQVQKITDRSFNKLIPARQAYTWYGYLAGEGLSLVTLDGKVTPVLNGPPYDGSDPQINRPLFTAPDGTDWFWDGNGLFLAGPNHQPQQLFPIPVTNLTQSPTDRNLFFFISYDGPVGNLYIMRAGEWKPYLIDERIHTPAGIHWTG